MVCSHCQREIAEYSNFCYYCGSRQQAAPQQFSAARKRLMRSASDCKVAGVCAGFAEYLDVDPTIVRLVWVVLSIVPGGFVGGIIAYLAAWIIMPRAPQSVTAPSQVGTTQAAPSR
jgi:phage shock protein C